MTTHETVVLPDSLPDTTRYLSEAACRELMRRVMDRTTGGGYTALRIDSACTGIVRWGRNQVTTAGEMRSNMLRLARVVNGAAGTTEFSATSEDELTAAVRRAEQLLQLDTEVRTGALLGTFPVDPASTPAIFSTATDTLDVTRRTEAVQPTLHAAAEAGLLSAGFLEVSTFSRFVTDTYDRSRYYQWTFARYTVTVRDPKGTASGWAGIDHHDWSKINSAALAQRALDKCLASRNPARIEPGRYTVILEPQAVGDLIYEFAGTLGAQSSFVPTSVEPELAEPLVDTRLSFSTDPMDPELGYLPWVQDWLYWDYPGQPVRPAVFIDRGIFRIKGHYGSAGRGIGQSDSYRIGVSGPTMSLEEMIATTKRGLLVTRFDRVQYLTQHFLCRGYTCDGLWLVENGKITKACKNLLFVESALGALNRVEQVGVPTRILRKPNPVLNDDTVPQGAIVPALKIRDFSFTALTDSV